MGTNVKIYIEGGFNPKPIFSIISQFSTFKFKMQFPYLKLKMSSRLPIPFLFLLSISMSFIAPSIGFGTTYDFNGTIYCYQHGRYVKLHGMEVELWDYDSFEPDDQLATTKTDANGNFHIVGRQFEIGHLDPYLWIEYNCDPVRELCEFTKDYWGVNWAETAWELRNRASGFYSQRGIYSSS
jgi:hypothetical protein